MNSDFIIKYVPYGKGNSTAFYKLIDPFCIFYLHFIDGIESIDMSIFSNNDSPKMISWRGFAYENVAFNHIKQIKETLGIKNVSTTESTFFEKDNNEITQIDLLIDRDDNIVNLCEIKFYSDIFIQDKREHLSLLKKQVNLSKYIKKKKVIRNTLITTYGIKDNEYQWDYDSVIILDDLFID